MANAVLWVDDNHKNNSYFIELLQERGYLWLLQQAPKRLSAKQIETPTDLILSDMAGQKTVNIRETQALSCLRNLGNEALKYHLSSSVRRRMFGGFATKLKRSEVGQLPLRLLSCVPYLMKSRQGSMPNKGPAADAASVADLLKTERLGVGPCR